MAPTMIYHAPYPLNPQATSASGIRPVQMRRAFDDSGYQVLEVTGTPAQRKSAIRTVKQYLASGKTIDFLYSESATIPTMVAGKKHLPPHPLLDIDLFRLCKRCNIPTSLFYRDVYWMFDSYTETVNPAIARIMQALYRYDLHWYSKYVDRLYLPSEKMAEYVPIFPKARTAALPPGSNVCDIPSSQDGALNLLYIGGLGEHYKLHEAVRAVTQMSGVTLTICTREAEWKAVAEQYAPLMDDSIRVVHRSGEGLIELYSQADVCSLFVDPGEYRSFAAPVKLYEYVGYGMPVITSSGTHAATFVKENSCGWSVDYSASALCDLMGKLQSTPEVLEQMKAQVRQERHNHTWRARASQVVADMAALKASR